MHSVKSTEVISELLTGARNSWAKKPTKLTPTRERYLQAESRCGSADRGFSGSAVSPKGVHTYIYRGVNSTVADKDVENVLSRILSEVFRA